MELDATAGEGVAPGDPPNSADDSDACTHLLHINCIALNPAPLNTSGPLASPNISSIPRTRLDNQIMPFIILGDREQEFERRPLRQAMTIGRSFDCDLPVRDALLSRQHCRIEPHGNQWVLIDLKSRNGTRIGDDPISRHILEDGDVVHIGQTRLCFRAGAFVPAGATSPFLCRPRPLDPLEAMATTMTGAAFTAGAKELHIPGFPTPKPKPAEPKSFQNDGVEALVSKIASGVWDTRLASQALTRRPAQVIPWPDQERLAAKNPSAPEKQSRKPAKRLVMAYMVMAGAVFAASMFAITWPGI